MRKNLYKSIFKSKEETKEVIEIAEDFCAKLKEFSDKLTNKRIDEYKTLVISLMQENKKDNEETTK